MQRGTLAQLVEQRTFNPLVTSSNLVRPTTLIQKNQFKQNWFFFVFAISSQSLKLSGQFQPAQLEFFQFIFHRFETLSRFGNVCRSQGAGEFVVQT